jgi:hypothetical protein
MTAPARITQDDIKRTLKAIVKDAEIERARVIIRLATSEIEVIIGESPDAEETAASATGNPWDTLLPK